MTTPNQSLPTTVETLLGIGAFQIGGGGTTFGQDIDDDFVDNLVRIPYATLDNMIDVLQMVLLRLPIEALQAFSSLIPDWLEEPITDVAEAVGLIIDALQARDIPMLLSVFEDFVEDMLDSLGIPILGDLVDKIFDLTDGFDTLFGGFDILDGGILNQLVNALTGSGGDLTDITAWVSDIPVLGDIVEALTGIVGGDYTDITAWVADIPVLGDIIEMIVEAITGITSGDLTDLETFFDDVPILSDLVDALTGTPGDITDLDSFFSSLLGIIGGTAPTGSGVLGDIFDRLQFLDTGGVFDASQLGNISNIPAIAQSKITGLTAALASLLSATSFQDLLDKLYQAVNGGSSTGNTAAAVKAALQAIPQGNITGLTSALSALLSSTVFQDLLDKLYQGINGGSSTGNTAAAVKTALSSIPQANITGLTTLSSNVVTGFQNIFNNWFGGSSASGTPAEVATTFASVRAAVAGGFTLQTFTSNNASWSVPAGLADATEAYAGAIGGGGKGTSGTTLPGGGATFAFGGVGGSSGGYIVNQFDASTLGSTLNVTVGAAASSSGTNGGTSSILNGGTTLASSIVNTSGISTPAGYALSSSIPGRGGAGGGVNDSLGEGAEDGYTGESSAGAAGGTGGANHTASGSGTGGTGTAGTNGTYTNVPISGGGGGGGGGGAYSGSGTGTGGTGGTGGFPGGGSGGGGAAQSFTGETAGVAGTPANGLAFLIWR